MIIRQYDRIKMKSGSKGVVVEVLEPGKAYLADIERDGDTYTDEITQEEIESKI